MPKTGWESKIMGSGLSKKKRELRILLLGLDSAGKSTILYRLKMGETIQSLPTVGFNVETVKHRKTNFNIWDVGGQDKIRPLWRHYYTGTQGLIFVVDCADHDRIDEARRELQRIISDREMRDCVILVYANKQDLKDSIKSKDIHEKLGLDKETGRHWTIQPSCAKNGEGLQEGLDWLMESIIRAEREQKEARKRAVR